MTLRRYAPLKASLATTWPPDVARDIRARDKGCVGPRVGMPGECWGSPELDHIRASGAIGKKSPSVVTNGCQLCSIHHREKTLRGRQWRPHLLAWVEQQS